MTKEKVMQTILDAYNILNADPQKFADDYNEKHPGDMQMTEQRVWPYRTGYVAAMLMNLYYDMM